MKSVAFATTRPVGLAPDDRPVAEALRSRGIQVTPAVWDDPVVHWESFAAVVIRSTWDYYLKVDAFRAWLDARQAEGCALWNGPELVRWNMDKAYLGELAARGVPIIDTALIRKGEAADLPGLLRKRGWARAVVKPAVSASAVGTWVARNDEGSRSKFAAALEGGDQLVQPFAEELVREGEWSFVFLDGRFSHAVLKRPKKGDFRVQEKHGGTIESADASEALIAQAQDALDEARTDTLYARVDGVVRDGRLLLMELEVFEPSLYLAYADGAAERFAEEIAARL